MTTMLNLPEDLAREVQRRAEQEGHDVAAEVVDLVRKALATCEPARPMTKLIPPTITRDPETGLPKIQGAPNAPISRMTTDEILMMYEQSQSEEDFERLGISPRR